MAEGYLSDLLGVHDLRDSDGQTLPRRNVLMVRDADVHDDPVAGETVIGLRVRHEVQSVPVGGGEIVNVDADVYRVSDAGTFYGLGAPTEGGRQRVFIINASDGNITLVHDSDSADHAEARFYTQAQVDLIMASQNMVLCVYDSGSSRWRVL
jgi:hypothetical protein